jgi:hypothetical protein
MRFSDYAPFGLLRFGEDSSPAERIYQAYVDANPRSAADDPHQTASWFARAMGQAASLRALERAKNQHRLSKVSEMLDRQEADYDVTPSHTDSEHDRRARLLALAKVASGGSRGNVVGALKELLGDDFLSLHTIPVGGAETWPASPASGPTNCRAANVKPREVRLTMPASLVPAGPAPIEVTYENADTSRDDEILVAGDIVVVDGGNLAIAERVEVEAVSDSNGVRAFTATFTKPHAEGAIVTTVDWPMQWSTNAFTFVVVTSSAAVDQVKRQRTHALMHRMLKGASQWAIVSPSSPGALTAGPFVLGVSPLGAAPIAQFTFTPS